jgi:maltose/moltooligosaccharide transporter
VQFVPSDLFGVLILPKIPTEEELKKIKRGALQVLPFTDIFSAIKDKNGSIGYLFQWYLILLWQNSSKSISLSVWNTTLKDI